MDEIHIYSKKRRFYKIVSNILSIPLAIIILVKVFTDSEGPDYSFMTIMAIPVSILFVTGWMSRYYELKVRKLKNKGHQEK